MDFGVQIDEEKQQNKQVNLDDSLPQSQQNQRANYGACGLLSVAYYQPYFNVNQYDVLQRLKASLLPLKADFLHLIQSNPDLWGPVWICATLVLLIAASGNFMKYIVTNGETIQYDFRYVPVSAALLYSLGFGTPIVLTVLLKFLGSDTQLFQTICLYGYSMAILVPITLFCSFPYSWIQWPLVLYGLTTSIIFLIRNLQEEISKLEQQKKVVVQGIIIGIQVLLYLTFKLYFFSLM